MSGSHPPRALSLSSRRRRALLKIFAASGLLAVVERSYALAKDADDYRALVCVYQQGGNDGENTLVRYDAAGYANYAALRPASSGVNIPLAELHPILPTRLGTPFGFHPSLRHFKVLFDQRKLAVVANMGMLVQPTDKVGLESGDAPRPANLFSHSDQQLAAHSSDYHAATRTGWGGRMADKLAAANPGAVFPPMTSTTDLYTYVSGLTSVPLSVPESAYFTPFASGPDTVDFDALRDGALREMLGRTRTNLYDLVAQLYAEEGYASASVLAPLLQDPASKVAPFFAHLDTSMARQFTTIARLVEARAATKLRRQAFYVHQWGYDTHGGQLEVQGRLLSELAAALEAFHAALDAIGVGSNVTTFTLSEFGRTMKPATNGGTDHGWGNHAFVMGGAVRGGEIYGTLPAQVLNGPDDFGKDGRWIPSTSIEQYGATLARWMGIAEGDLPYVFPNLAAFPSSDLGFL